MVDQDPPLHPDSNASSNAVSAVIEALQRQGTPQELMQIRLSQDVVAVAAAKSSENETVSDQILEILFPEALPDDLLYYEKIANIELRLGANQETYDLVGTLWARLFARLRSEAQQELLNAMVQPGTRYFFSALHALPAFLRQCSMDSHVLAIWLLGVRKTLGNDWASKPFWDSLQILSEVFPNAALEVAQHISASSLEDDAITIAAVILGHLRLSNPAPIGLSDFEGTLSVHQDINRRLIFHRSWITSGLREPLSDQQFADTLGRMTSGTREEINEAFNFIRCLLPQESTSDESFALSMGWLHKHTTNTVPEFWKHFVLSLATTIFDRWMSTGHLRSEPPPYDLAIAIQPILPENKGTWRELEKLLIALLQADQAEFRRILFGLAQTNPVGLLQHLRSFDEFTELSSALRLSDGADVITEAILSHDDAVRNLGFTLFWSTGLETLSMAQLNVANENAIAVVIFAFRLQPFYDEVIPRFLLALLPRINRSSRGLKNLFVEEMLFQSKNLPGTCFEVLKKRGKTSALVRKAVQEAEDYFDRLKACHRSAVNSMGIPGLERAMRLKAVRESRAMSAQIKEKSVFTQLFATSYTLYGGKRWQTFFGSNLGDVSEMKEISHSAEFPTMPGIDPDGMAQRAHRARRMIRRLLATPDSN